ncbi:MAG: DNA polymerase III subunit delta' C-terminal domain-containing protein, partial [Candidatus Eisenbacteria bacterium]|nr:DNA polymerase III subunit delta' C-terminal domain-containing protein [Candidatus Eisenbacteria bacterium]
LGDVYKRQYLFHGPRGVGETRTALGLAQALECGAEADRRPCGACLGCRKVAALIHPDLRLLFPATRDEESSPEDIARRLHEYAAGPFHLLEFARNATIGIERVRELKAEAGMALVEGPRRVYILADAPRMTEDAAQSALKLIEEPPPGTHLILIAEEPSMLLPTIVSRCQQVRFRPLRRETIEEILAARFGVAPKTSRLIAALAQGSLGRALQLRLEDSIPETRDRALSLLHVDPERAQEKTREWSRSLDPNAARRTVELLLLWCRDLLAVKFGQSPDSLANPDRLDLLEKEAARMPVATLRAWVDALEEMVDSIDRNVNPALSLFEALSQIAGEAPGATRSTTAGPQGRSR